MWVRHLSKKWKYKVAKGYRKNLTNAEARLWCCLRKKQLGVRFCRQFVLYGFIADFYCARVGLVVEVDGKIHDAQKDKDKERDMVLLSHGIHTVRVSNELVMNNLGLVVCLIRNKLKIVMQKERKKGLAKSKYIKK